MNPETTGRGWVLTAAAFERLLGRLDPDPERAGERYEELRRKLVWFFEAKGSLQAAEDADETINRVARRLEQGEPIKSVVAYSLGVARMIRLETLRRQAREQAGAAALSVLGPPAVEEPDARWTCLDACLGALAGTEREMILAYYHDEAGGRADLRRQLAERLGISSSLLRGRVFRIRERLQACVGRCLSGIQDASTLLDEGARYPREVPAGTALASGSDERETGGTRRQDG